MRGRGKIYVLIIILLLLVTTIFNEVKYIRENQVEETFDITKTAGIDTSIYCTFSDVENDVKHLAANPEKEKELARLIDPLTKSNLITASYVFDVIDIVGVPDDLYVDLFDRTKTHGYVTKESFGVLYDRIVHYSIVPGLSRVSVFVFDKYVKQNEDNLPDTTMIYDGNRFYESETEISDEYQDKMIDVFMKDNIIYKVNGLGSDNMVFQNVWLEKISDGKFTFLYNGVRRSYNVATEDTNNLTGGLANITISNEGITDISKPYNLIDAKVIDANEFGLRLADQGFLKTSDQLQIYNVSHVPYCEDSRMVLTGYKNVKIALTEKEIQAVIVSDDPLVENIRVILSNSNYSSYEMPQVKLTCDTRYKVVYPDESETVYDAGEVLQFKPEDYEKDSVLSVEPLKVGGKVCMLNIAREYGTPFYAGKMEIRFFDEYMYAINELPIEEYLYSVVSSEMPSSNPPEALKAMAICARGYAYSKLLDNSFDDFYGDLDDTSLCQMYNNIEETEESIKAVKDTYGLVPYYEESVIYPFSFSTSCGVTCTNEDIWGGTAYDYLKSSVQTKDKKEIDLSNENDFKKFIQNPDEYDMIEKEYPYFRWHISFTEKEMSEAIMSTIEDRLKNSPDNIIVTDKEGEVISDSEDGEQSAGNVIDAVGDIVDVKVTGRSKSGVVSTLVIECTDGTIELTGQTNIRNIITPVNQEIIRQDDSAITGWTSLPSPYYYIEHGANGYTIYGGGFGHGSGMSQNGAKKLAELGYDCENILKHYYDGISLDRIYKFEDEVDGEED